MVDAEFAGDPRSVEPEHRCNDAVVQVDDAVCAHPRAVEPRQLAVNDPHCLGGRLHEPDGLIEGAVLTNQRAGDRDAHQVQFAGDRYAPQADSRVTSSNWLAGP